MTKECPPTDLAHYEPYRLGNSPHGLMRAHLTHKKWIDLDCQESADKTLWNMHWGFLYKDGYRIPNGGPLMRTGRRRVSSLTDLELAQVVSKTDGIRPHKFIFMVKQAMRLGINVEHELKMKPSVAALEKYFEQVGPLQDLYPHWSLRVKILQGVLNKHEIINTFELVKFVAAKHNVRLDTLYLNHDKQPVRFTHSEERFVDLVRGLWTTI